MMVLLYKALRIKLNSSFQVIRIAVGAGSEIVASWDGS